MNNVYQVNGIAKRMIRGEKKLVYLCFFLIYPAARHINSLFGLFLGLRTMEPETAEVTPLRHFYHAPTSKIKYAIRRKRSFRCQRHNVFDFAGRAKSTDERHFCGASFTRGCPCTASGAAGLDQSIRVLDLGDFLLPFVLFFVQSGGSHGDCGW